MSALKAATEQTKKLIDAFKLLNVEADRFDAGTTDFAPATRGGATTSNTGSGTAGGGFSAAQRRDERAVFLGLQSLERQMQELLRRTQGGVNVVRSSR